ncbi:MAG: anti-sigma factor family protein [Cellvibrionaceae bacterium]
MQKKFTDEELTAYLDGEYEYTRADEIKKALAHDQNLKTRLEQLSFGKEDLRMAFDDILDVAPDLEPIQEQEAQAKSAFQTRSKIWQPSFASAAAFALICFGLGLGSHFILPKAEALNGWQAYVAAYQALYINSTLSHIDNDNEQKAIELQRVSSALGKEIVLDNINSLQQLDYKRAQILGYKGQPLAQLTFLSSTDAPIALCIIRSQSTALREINMTELEGMSSASWEKEGYSYLLIGGNDSMLIKDMANKFSAYL